ncbi:MAG: hypothetical protein ACJ758_04605 [Actinomycetota bacterium]
MRRLGFALTMATALGIFLAGPAFSASAAQQNCYPAGNPTASVSDPTPTAGETVTVSGGNYKPDSGVDVLFDGDKIAHGQTDGQGQFSFQVTIPNDASLGDHTITVSGVGGDCVSPADVEIGVTLVVGESGGGGGGGGAGGAGAAGGNGGGGVAFTGANISLGMLLIAVFVIVGAASLIVGRRRKVGAGAK